MERIYKTMRNIGAEFPEQYIHRGDRRGMRHQPELFRQDLPQHGGTLSAGISDALPDGKGDGTSETDLAFHCGYRFRRRV